MAKTTYNLYYIGDDRPIPKPEDYSKCASMGWKYPELGILTIDEGADPEQGAYYKGLSSGGRNSTFKEIKIHNNNILIIGKG